MMRAIYVVGMAQAALVATVFPIQEKSMMLVIYAVGMAQHALVAMVFPIQEKS